jgi:signal transduction histidine kinase
VRLRYLVREDYINAMKIFRSHNAFLRTWLVAAVLLVALPVLAVLQYRWLGDLSDREADRMRHNLRVATVRFSVDFSQAFMNVQQTFLIDKKNSQAEFVKSLAERCQQWQTSEHPELISDVFYLSPDDTTRLFKFNPITETLDTIAWQPETRLWQQVLLKPREIRTRLLHGSSPPFPTRVLDNFSALAIQVMPDFARFKFDSPSDKPLGYVVLSLNRNYLWQTFVPQLAKTHFQADSDITYQFIITDRVDTSRVFYASDPTLAVTAFRPADMDVPIVLIPPLRMPDGSRERNALRHMMNRPEGVAMEFLSSRSRGTTAFIDAYNSWQLLVKYQGGSLDAVVNGIRVRNLFISFGILLLLGAGIVFVLVAAAHSERLAQQQLQFIAGVSHELRTPLAVIRSASENLADGIVSNPERTLQYGKLIKRETDRLWQMIEEVLEFSGIQSGRKRYEFQPVNVADIINQTLAECRPLLTEQQVQVDANIDANLPPLMADATALKSAIHNLLTNAVKYGGDRKWIGLEAKVRHTASAKELDLTVRDAGIGIAADDEKHLFEPFYRSKQVVDAQIHGNGLGLSLVKHIVEAHGGRIGVKSSLGEGSAFTLHFPLSESADTIV